MIHKEHLLPLGDTQNNFLWLHRNILREKKQHLEKVTLLPVTVTDEPRASVTFLSVPALQSHELCGSEDWVE